MVETQWDRWTPEQRKAHSKRCVENRRRQVESMTPEQLAEYKAHRKRQQAEYYAARKVRMAKALGLSPDDRLCSEDEAVV